MIEEMDNYDAPRLTSAQEVTQDTVLDDRGARTGGRTGQAMRAACCEATAGRSAPNW